MAGGAVAPASRPTCPAFRHVAGQSPHGEGSITILERLLPWWRDELFVLVLLGFAAIDFLITMTLSAANATAHLVENPFVPGAMHGHNVAITLLLALLGGIFLAGFSEAMGIARRLHRDLPHAELGRCYGLGCAVSRPSRAGLSDWSRLPISKYPDLLLVVVVALLVFPKLALGLSGFETGVAVMSLIQADERDTEDQPTGRIRDARKLLTTASVVMSAFLLSTSAVTTLLIPPDAFRSGGRQRARRGLPGTRSWATVSAPATT